jgi:branched-chain amino acid transport system substrate-binding protein
MRLLYRLSMSFLFLLPMSLVFSQEKIVNYGNIPDELVAYDRYMKAYKYHFLVPIKFYGAGREIPPPTNL